ncbi:5'/3'-nucleotidase SurE [Pikeienuella piscinae]|uniref:5'-nucleotidase SurE n=1 Tax=Pikeienuella piscinae TaxID=2748098 RepID=A0A7L5BYE9_9RHOB|nr:5'/3'-nucleotidase SurE [Pikeienuella piscinae]QIE54629.1 5'/3'-nucleotidase SurE [Pikeienuella piscinae]
MRILIVNDDGINGPGLKVAEEIAVEVAGPSGEIWVVAPETERSGASHCVSYTAPMRVTQLEERRFCIEGHPADCAIAGIVKLLPERPDLVLSGVNRGHNVAEDAVYSGTVAGAKEGAIQDVRSIALSQFFAAGLDAPEDLFAAARAHGAATVRRVLALPTGPDVFYNVNFPARAADEVKGFRLAPQGRRGGAFEVQETIAPNQRRYFWLKHGGRNVEAAADADCTLCANGWITATPMRPDLTDHALLAEAMAAHEAAE